MVKAIRLLIWVSYLGIQSYIGKELMRSILRQVAVSGITGTDLMELYIDCPDIHEQHVITHILGTFDDKIEQNRKMNNTLEAIVQSLFKSWFVNFESVCEDPANYGLPSIKLQAQGGHDGYC